MGFCGLEEVVGTKEYWWCNCLRFSIRPNFHYPIIEFPHFSNKVCLSFLVCSFHCVFFINMFLFIPTNWNRLLLFQVRCLYFEVIKWSHAWLCIGSNKSIMIRINKDKDLYFSLEYLLDDNLKRIQQYTSHKKEFKFIDYVYVNIVFRGFLGWRIVY